MLLELARSMKAHGADRGGEFENGGMRVEE